VGGTSTTTLPGTSTTTTTTTGASTTSTTLFAAEHLLGCKKFVLKDNPAKPRKRGFTLVCKDPTLSLVGPNGGTADPVVHGALIRVVSSDGDGFDDSYALPAARWRYVGKQGLSKGYKFSRGTPVRAVRVRPSTLKVKAKGDALGHTLGTDPRPVAVDLRLGDTRFCFEFGGTIAFTANKKFISKNPSPPGACPPLP